MSTPNEHIESGFEPPGCTPPDPTPSAPSLQSVAEGAARELSPELAKIIDHPEHYIQPNSAGVRLQEEINILTRHFAPLLTERDERIGRLERENENYRTGLFPATTALHAILESAGCESVRKADLTALRTRCEEMERDKARLEALFPTNGLIPIWTQTTGHSIARKLRNRKTLELTGKAVAQAIVSGYCAAREEGQQAHEKGEA